MATGTSMAGKPVQVGDFVTLNGSVASVSLPNITVTLVGSGLSITASLADFDGPSASGAGRTTPVAGDACNVNGIVLSVSGSGGTASLSVQLQEKTVTAQANDCYNGQTL